MLDLLIPTLQLVQLPASNSHVLHDKAQFTVTVSKLFSSNAMEKVETDPP